MSKTPLVDAAQKRANALQMSGIWPLAKRLERDRAKLLDALKEFVIRYPNNVGADRARALIAKVENGK